MRINGLNIIDFLSKILQIVLIKGIAIETIKRSIYSPIAPPPNQPGTLLEYMKQKIAQ